MNLRALGRVVPPWLGAAHLALAAAESVFVFEAAAGTLAGAWSGWVALLVAAPLAVHMVVVGAALANPVFAFVGGRVHEPTTDLDLAPLARRLVSATAWSRRALFGTATRSGVVLVGQAALVALLAATTDVGGFWAMTLLMVTGSLRGQVAAR